MKTQPSSRTPEGDDNHCPVCGNDVRIDPTRPPGDAPCPHCGNLLWFSAHSVDSLESRRAAVLWHRANAALAQEKIDVAIRLVRRAVSLDPNNEQFRSTLSDLQNRERVLQARVRRPRRPRRQAS
ncbi:MAG: tetratricopeptide repeat protein [Planctomycetales bacterium]|nr:tetratricopeptide repeat protein [Planctomycetales bacterium]